MLEGGNNPASWNWEGKGSVKENTGKMEDIEDDIESYPLECDWLDVLAEDPYYRGLQDKVPVLVAGGRRSRGAFYQRTQG